MLGLPLHYIFACLFIKDSYSESLKSIIAAVLTQNMTGNIKNIYLTQSEKFPNEKYGESTSNFV